MMICSECGEPVIHRPPDEAVPWRAQGMPVPQWSHLDGTALCPVVGPDGYRPAGPVTNPA